MKTTLVLAALAALIGTPAAFAQAKYGSAGCGLGSIIIGPGEGFSQVFAATSNGMGGQSFGITSGTSNCVNQDKAALNEQQESFMMANYSALSKEMAQGRGETLASFADVLGCSQGAQPRFASVLQNSYARIFSAPGALAALEATRREIKGHAELAQACSKLI